MDATKTEKPLSTEIEALGLAKYARELDEKGLTVVPPETTGVPLQQIDRMVHLLLDRAKELIGCEFELDRGPQAELEFESRPGQFSATGETPGKPSQFLIQQLCSYHRAFRDLAINPVAVALIRHMIGRNATRFSSHNSFIKWQGEYGYGASLGMHADQTATPRPWGLRARTSNTNWCLTDYTHEGGALAYVPGSHLLGHQPTFPEATDQAVPVEAAKGSIIVFHGATWHGAFPRTIPGMRISVANYYRHAMITSQEDIQGSFDQSLADDCADPDLFRTLAGFRDQFPYKHPSEALPRLASPT